jgi:hypothetical protein
MNNFQEGDILIGKKRSFAEAYHPIVFISGPEEAPLAVVLTHSNNFSCNLKLSSTYGSKTSYFVSHLIEKMAEWGPYEKEEELTPEDLDFIKKSISGVAPITWATYESYTKSGCPDHN